MIKNNESKVEITSGNIKYYLRKKYICEIGDIISVDTNTMAKMSHNKVIAICDICKSERELTFSKYNKNKERQDYYSCSKCSDEKRKITNIKKYGVENAFKREDVKENNRKWMASDEFKNKSKESLIEKYGVDSYSKTNEFKNMISEFNIDNYESLKEKRESTCLERYGYKSILEIPNLVAESMNKKYGASASFLVKEIKEKIQNVNFEKFGHISPFGNKEVQEKAKDKVLEIYGVDNVWKNKEMIQIMLNKKRELGIYYKNEELRNKYTEYRRKVVYLTKLNKDELVNNWDGNDFYTGIYIRDNFNLNCNDSNYPTIDHKMPVIYGFLNNLKIEELSNIKNLCWTTRANNLKKWKSYQTSHPFDI